MIKADGLHEVIHYKKITSDHCPSFSGIAAGECKGELWVDNLENANIAIAKSYAVGGFAFLGEITSEEQYKAVEVFLHEELFAWLESKGINYFEFSIESDQLGILKMFENREIRAEKEFSFRKNSEIPELLSLSAGYTIHQVDNKLWNLINEGSIENGAFVTKRILGSWESFDDFLEKSLAYCITYSNRIVAVIAGTARFNDVIAIDIETEEAHRNRGLALIMTAKFVNECISRGMTAQWDCVESNPASRKLAEKAGFTFVRENEVYWFDL
ncbi:GNAT family N-acetyltransferase [Paenibacillus gorillae]|uniref:GNAT family N-acetyltransferase n=1 Tax=Paenibacillus gorillae TaxID=1243662 RepID=UPI0004AD1A1C|nr:GNAT family N-acetyltransferase [Paenibacillus gorillae]